MNKALTIIALIGAVVALASFSAKVRSAEISQEMLESATRVDVDSIPHAKHGLAFAIRALELDARCIRDQRLVKECRLMLFVVPGPVEANGSNVCGFMIPGTPALYVVIGGKCAQAVGDDKFMGTLVHEYVHLLQTLTGRYAGHACGREYREIEAHAVGNAFTADTNDGRGILFYLKRCAAK